MNEEFVPHSDKPLEKRNTKGLIIPAVWLARIITGAAFIFSGFVKGVDPWGTIYKFQDYLGAMDLHIWPSLVNVGAFALCIFEFVLGVQIFLGCFRRSAPWMALLFMGVMLPLTFWILISNPVADCGCFGDAWVISNSATFWKNVFLTLLIIFLLKYNCRARCLITPALQWIETVVSGLYLVLVALYGFYVQPTIDFRPFPVGSTLISGNSVTDDTDAAENMRFIYRKGELEKEFSASDELPSEDDGWEFIRRVEPARTEIRSGVPGLKENEFRIWSRDGEDDLTEEVLEKEGNIVILLMPDLSETSVASTWRINELTDWCKHRGIEIMAVVAGSPEEIDAFEDITLPSYPIYTAEDTAIKEIARSNPAVVFIRNGQILWKTSLWSMDVDRLTEAPDATTPDELAPRSKELLNAGTGLYIIIMAFLIAMSFMPYILTGGMNKLQRFIRGGKARRAESSGPDKSVR